MGTFSLVLLLLSSCVDARYPTLEYPRHAQVNPHPSGRPTPVHGNSTSNPHPTAAASCEPYWLENVKHQGVASFNSNSTYQVFRNVKDYGAVGDGQTDDTAAIQRAVSEGGRCAPGVCQSSTTTPAVVYFPEGTYLISASIIDYYYTQV
jgi:glucan 1,3-beta-glucosidase